MTSRVSTRCPRAWNRTAGSSSSRPNPKQRQTQTDTLLGLLAEAQQLGFLGRAPVEEHVIHSRRFVEAAPVEPGRCVDLGSGAGIPALPLALTWPRSEWVLVEIKERRAAFLRRAIETLGLADRCVVDERRAEVVGRDPMRRGWADLVTSRGFGPPAAAAECGAPLLRVGGYLMVSEPPDPRERWPEQGLAALGLARIDEPGGLMAVMVQTRPCPEEYPRRDGVPANRPLFVSRGT